MNSYSHFQTSKSAEKALESIAQSFNNSNSVVILSQDGDDSAINTVVTKFKQRSTWSGSNIVTMT